MYAQGILVAVLAVSGILWYSVSLDEKGDVTPELDAWFVLSYALWIAFALMQYVILGIWCSFIDTNGGKPGNESIRNLVVWNSNRLMCAFGVGFFSFLVSMLVIKYQNLTVSKNMTRQKMKGTLIPLANKNDAMTMNYIKGFLVTFAIVSVSCVLLRT